MGIYGQPNSWQCGPFALKHALLSVGIFTHEDELTRLAGSSTEVGTDEHQLGVAARAYGCTLPVVRRGSAEGARHALNTLLDRGHPVLLCVDNWDHWITAVAMHADRVVLFDSHYDQPLRVECWDVLATRLVFHSRSWRGVWRRAIYDLVPVVPAGGVHRLSLGLHHVEHLLRPDNAPLARRWDEDAATLLELAATPSRQLELGFPLDNFLVARRESIVTAATSRAGLEIGGSAGRLIDDLSFVASLYRPHLSPEREPVAVEHLAAHVSKRLQVQPAVAA